jgi:1-acyl-sn-glycerol-3-phosphate acyltransferase
MDFVYNVLYRLVQLTIKIILGISGTLTVYGRENIPEKGGVIVACNHISYLDPPLVGAVLPRIATFMARKGLFDVPVLGWMISRAAFPVDRENPRPSSIKDAVTRLKKGELIVLFPEGKRSETGELQEARRGVDVIARLSKATIVPTYLHGSNKALPFHAKWIKRADISVVFGKPIYYNAISETESDTGKKQDQPIGSTIMHAIGELKRDFEQKKLR